ncbi:hypothetical protein PoB_001303000 [Plakobranchus ocellatus]|uniref:Uncharacterized protein n=1 Tax=Plakobranchus ocellatus TaxID=259542 RepID=A0AAV3YTK4_9GAST|nr:hypothetical protein PoB_001303000 [Plakobranchus ocellatus]
MVPISPEMLDYELYKLSHQRRRDTKSMSRRGESRPSYKRQEQISTKVVFRRRWIHQTALMSALVYFSALLSDTLADCKVEIKIDKVVIFVDS